jgi:two-component system response regulator CpxR
MARDSLTTFGEGTVVAAPNRVLLVEDDLDVRDTLQDLLESEGLDVIPAANGKQAIDFLTLNDPPGADLVILDLMMPLVSGWQVLEVLTADRTLRRIPVIVLSALPVSRPERALEIVRKPFAFETLVASIHKVLPA